MLGKATALGSLPSHTHLIMGAGWDWEVSLWGDIWGSVLYITLAAYEVYSSQGAIQVTHFIGRIYKESSLIFACTGV